MARGSKLSDMRPGHEYSFLEAASRRYKPPPVQVKVTHDSLVNRQLVARARPTTDIQYVGNEWQLETMTIFQLTQTMLAQ